MTTPTPRDAREIEARENIELRVGNRWAEKVAEFGVGGTVTYPRQSLDEALDRYAEAVRATTDAAWREKVREACEAEKRADHSAPGSCTISGHSWCVCGNDAHNAALAALAARLGLEETR